MERSKLQAVCCAIFIVLSGWSSSAGAKDFVTGVNSVHLGWSKPDEQDKIIKNMVASGVKAVRLSLVPPYENSIDAIQRLNANNIGVLLVVEIAGTQLTAADAKRRPGRGGIHAVVPLSQLNPAFFREQFTKLWSEIEHRKLRLIGLELGNEINWAAFNGDLAVTEPGAAATSNSGPLSIAHSDEFERGLKAYVAALQVVRQLRDSSEINKQVPIISAGLAWMSQDFARRSGAEFVDVNKTVELLESLHFERYVDAIGLHFYPSSSATPERRLQQWTDLTKYCDDKQSHKQCWVTEWGVAQDNNQCPASDTHRLPVVREMKTLFRQSAAASKLGGAFYFDWESELPYSIWRCNSLTPSGQVLFQGK